MPRGWEGLAQQRWKGWAYPEWRGLAYQQWRGLHQRCVAGLNNHTTTLTTKTLHKVYDCCTHPVQNTQKLCSLAELFDLLFPNRRLRNCQPWRPQSICLHDIDSYIGLSHEFRTCRTLETMKDVFLRIFTHKMAINDTRSKSD